jgi:RND family efflux transporter MFP subunit
VVGDTTRLATIVGGDPIYVYFDMDETTLLRHRRLLRNQEVKGARSPLVMELSNEKGFPHKGVLDTFDVRVNPATGTIRARGIFADPDRILVPGLSARVRLLLGKPHKVLLVAREAIGTAGDGEGRTWPYVVIVNARNVVESRKVTLGQRHGRLQAITDGIKPDEWVAISRDLQPGAKVKPRRVAMPGSLRSHEK